jgi:hypothetical protein
MNRISIISFILLLACSRLAAQSLQGIQENIVVKQFLAKHPVRLKSATGNPLLNLPFFEDFSGATVVPDPGKWADQHAFINDSYAFEPPSIGVATLDAIDEHGDVYALNDLPTSSDTLTSRGINLSAFTWPADTIRMSFFYQSGGKGEVPELKDSLLLEFYSPANDHWKRIWFACEDTVTPFQQVILEVPGLYYQNGFVFRFRNYTSLSARSVTGGEGAVSNADCWNIDYIMVNKLPVSTHEFIHDIALIEPPRYLLDFYESVPWLHLNDAQSITRNYLRYVFRNLQKNDIANLGRSYYARNLGNGYTEYAEEFYDNFVAEEIIRRNDPFFSPFARYDESEEGNVEVGGFLITPEYQYKQNDTAKVILHFKDYYAYDDGTPERGFGISGPSTSGALLAYRFRIYKADTLRAVDMFFNKARNHYNETLNFQLCVWKDDNGIPGELLYISPEEFSPAMEEGLTFKRYAINQDTNLLVTDTVVFVGWKQATEDWLNLGYDVNRDNVSRTFVNTSGEWFNPGNSLIPGSLMIRPVFGSKAVITGEPDIPETNSAVVMFPNPVSGMLYIKATGRRINKVLLYDVTGRMVPLPHGNVEFIDLSGVPSGIYQVVAVMEQDEIISQKIVVYH